MTIEVFDDIWKNYPMPEHYTCGCGLYVHPLHRTKGQIHIDDCYYNDKEPECIYPVKQN